MHTSSGLAGGCGSGGVWGPVVQARCVEALTVSV